ncbi:MAG TPA: hypothetical protein VFE23_10115 [Usitatibacter sp.]|jgi:hypothetical protein|nr:hypothetical protein [Usitatibacter sp.]
MERSQAFALATDLLKSFVESQDIPPGGTTGTARDHGEKTAQFLAGLHRTLFEYFRQCEDA